MPIDVDDTANGNVVFSDPLHKTCRVMSADETAKPRTSTQPLRYRSHFASCPNARTHRKRGAT